MSTPIQSALLLQKQLKGIKALIHFEVIFYKFLLEKKILFSRNKELVKNPVNGFSAGLINDDDIYKWEILIIGPPDTL
jgi:hypothetical protein